jgi:hypothetical protein
LSPLSIFFYSFSLLWVFFPSSIPAPRRVCSCSRRSVAGSRRDLCKDIAL